jgi:hypothetical protein
MSRLFYLLRFWSIVMVYVAGALFVLTMWR